MADNSSARGSNRSRSGGLEPEGELTAGEARRIALRAQGYLGAADRRGGVTAMLRTLGAVQLDTISVLARSHELVAYSRLGPIGRPAAESAYWATERPGKTFEFWAHAACILPIEEWPWFAFRRRHYRSAGWRWGRARAFPQSTADLIFARLRDEGPLTATELGGAKRGGPWWDWSDVKIAVELLLDGGEVVCVERTGWRRVYDLAERAVPAHLLSREPTDEECLTTLVAHAGRALGVSTIGDLADYYRLTRQQVESVIEASGLVPVAVAGWFANDDGRHSTASAPDGTGGTASSRVPRRQTGKASARNQRRSAQRLAALAWADPAALASPPRGRHRTTLLSPFDSLIWERRRTKRVFGWSHSLEAYKPAHKREHGYFAMPLLAGGRLIGRVDPKREGRTLVAKQASLDVPSPMPALVGPSIVRSIDSMADALVEAARWVGCDSVAVERVSPDWVLAPLRAAIAVRTS